MESQIKVLEQMDGNGTRVGVWEYQSLDGSRSIETAQALYYASKVGMKLRYVHIGINQASITLEPGALHYMKGSIKIEAKSGGLGGLVQKATAGMLTHETTFRPTYTGIGEIFLEPTFGHFLLIKLNDEEMIADKGMFYASESSVQVGVASQKHISSALFGGEGFFQTRIYGTGWVVLESPVPAHEVRTVILNNEKMQVDGNFALLRKGKIEFRVEKSTKSIIGASRSGEGLLQTFSGTGEVWLAPTQNLYQHLNMSALSGLMQPGISMGQKT